MYRHKMDVVSLVFGLLFASIGTLLMAGSFDLGRVSLAVVWPVIFVLVGLAMLLSARRRKEPVREIEPDRDLTASVAEEKSG
jgi:hypothetical protein